MYNFETFVIKFRHQISISIYGEIFSLQIRLSLQYYKNSRESEWGKIILRKKRRKKYIFFQKFSFKTKTPQIVIEVFRNFFQNSSIRSLVAPTPSPSQHHITKNSLIKRKLSIHHFRVGKPSVYSLKVKLRLPLPLSPLQYFLVLLLLGVEIEKWLWDLSCCVIQNYYVIIYQRWCVDFFFWLFSAHTRISPFVRLPSLEEEKFVEKSVRKKLISFRDTLVVIFSYLRRK